MHNSNIFTLFTKNLFDASPEPYYFFSVKYTAMSPSQNSQTSIKHSMTLKLNEQIRLLHPEIKESQFLFEKKYTQIYFTYFDTF